MNSLPKDLQIVSAEFVDLTGVLEILNDVILNSTANYDDTPHDLEYIYAWYNQMVVNNCPILVARRGLEIVGYACYAQFRNKVVFKYCMEHTVYVTKDFHGKGIGLLMMNELIKIAKERHIHTLVAGIDADNPGSIKFHENLGFERVGHMKEVGHKFGRWLDLVFMQKTL